MKITLIILGLLALLVLLSCAGLMPAVVEVPFTLAFGWLTYVGRVLPEVYVNRAGVAWSIIALAAFLLHGHAFAGWLWRETARAFTPSPGTPGEGGGEGLSSEPNRATFPAWRLRWTLAGAALLLLTFTAGIAATGVAHQSAWLARSEEPIFLRRFRTQDKHDQLMCSNNLEQIGYALREYTAAHAGRYPDTLAQLISPEFEGHMLTCPATDLYRYAGGLRGDHPADRREYTYYARNRRAPLPPRTLIASEPTINHDLAGVNILFADGKVEWHTPTEAQALLSAPREPTPGSAH